MLAGLVEIAQVSVLRSIGHTWPQFQEEHVWGLCALWAESWSPLYDQ